MASNNRDRIIKVAGYAKKVFFNENIEYRNFSPDLVGLQFTSDGGSALFTMGNFSITTNASPSQYTVFNLGTYSKGYTLDDLTGGDEQLLKIQKNIDAGLNLDITDPLTYIWYGSAEEMLRVSLTFLQNYFPAAIYVDNKIGATSGDNITSYSYNIEKDETTFNVSTNYFSNPYGITFTSDYKHKTTNEIGNTSNLLRNFTLNYSKYVVEHNGIIKNIKSIIPPTLETNATLTLVVDGNPFPEITGLDMSYLSFVNPTFSASSTPFFIKPNEVEQQNFFTSLNDLEKNILNLDIIPIYTMVLSAPQLTDDGVLVYTQDKITFPLLEDGYNLNFFDTFYLSYLDKLTTFTTSLDEYKTDIIIRKYVTDAVTSFDTIPRGDGDHLTLDGSKARKLFRIYGREFDEIKKYIDGIKLAHVVTYDGKNNIPDSLVKDLSFMLGLEPFNFLDNFNIKENVLPSFGEVTYNGISTTLSNQELDIEIYRRLILNIAWLWKSKGARKAVEFLLRFIGAPESLINFNEYIVIVDKPLDMDKIKKLLYIYTGSEEDVLEALKKIPYDENGYPLPPKNGDRVIVDYIEGPESGNTQTPSNVPFTGTPVFFQDYDLNNDGVLDVQDLNAWVTAGATTIVQDLVQIILGNKPLPPVKPATPDPNATIPDIVLSQEREMYFQKAGGWYRETAGAFAGILKLEGNNPHVGASVDINGNYSTYDGGSEYLSIFSRCYIPGFDGNTQITTNTSILYENNFLNYNYGIFNGVQEDTEIYNTFLSLDNQLIDDCIEVEYSIIETYPQPNGNTTLQSIYEEAKEDYDQWVEYIKNEPYLKYSPEWEIIKNNYEIAYNNYANEINTQGDDINQSLEICLTKIEEEVGDDGDNPLDPCSNFQPDFSNPPYISFIDPLTQLYADINIDCCKSNGGQFIQYMSPTGKEAYYCATNAPCTGKLVAIGEDGIAIFEMGPGNYGGTIYGLYDECYQLTEAGTIYFSNTKQTPQQYIDNIKKTQVFPKAFQMYFTKVPCTEGRNTLVTPDCCAWHNLNYVINPRTKEVHCVVKKDLVEYDDNSDSYYRKSPSKEINKKIQEINKEIIKESIEAQSDQITFKDKKEKELKIIQKKKDIIDLEKSKSQIKLEEAMTIKPVTGESFPSYKPTGNPDALTDIYKTLTVFDNARNEATIVKGNPKSSLYTVNTQFISSFEDPDLMNPKQWKKSKIDSLGRVTFSATDSKGNKHELDWTNRSGDGADLYVQVAKQEGLVFQNFVIDRVNNRLMQQKDGAPSNPDSMSAGVDSNYINCEGIDDVKIVFGSQGANGFYLPINVVGNNSIDISFDYMIKYDSETLYDCVGGRDQCGYPAIFNQNSMENVDCLNFIVFTSPTEAGENERTRLYDIFYNSENSKETINAFHTPGAQHEIESECCEILGGSYIPKEVWQKSNNEWVSEINELYQNFINNPYSVAVEDMEVGERQEIINHISTLSHYQKLVTKLIRNRCIPFILPPEDQPCNNKLFYNLITTTFVCALPLTKECGLYTKVYMDYKYLEILLSSMEQQLEICIKEKEDTGEIIIDIDGHIKDLETEKAIIIDNGESEDEEVNQELISTQTDIDMLTTDLISKEEDNNTITQTQIENQPQYDSTIYNTQIEEIDNFDVNEYCQNEISKSDISNTKARLNAFNQCVKQKENELREQKVSYIGLREETGKLQTLNVQLEDAKQKSQTNVVNVLETEIFNTEKKIDDFCAACGGIGQNNETLLIIQQNNSLEPAVIDNVARILKVTPKSITKDNKLDIDDEQKLTLKIIQSKNTSAISKIKDTLTEKEKKKTEIIDLGDTLKTERKLKEEEIDKLIKESGDIKGQIQYGDDEKARAPLNNITHDSPKDCCEILLLQVRELQTQLMDDMQSIITMNTNCYAEWFNKINDRYNTYVQSNSATYLNYLEQLQLNFNLEVKNVNQGNNTTGDLISNIITTPYGSNDIWDFDFLQDYSGVVIEGTNETDVINSIYSEIAGIVNLPPGGTISPNLFEPQWQTFNYTLTDEICELLKACYPGKQFYISLEIENFDCGLCILIDNIQINSNTYILENLITGDNCLIPELRCVIDNKKSWLYTDKGVKVLTTYPNGPCATGTSESSVVLTTPQNRLWQELEYRYTEYDAHHSDLIINTKSTSISVDPAKAIECDVYNFWRNIDCDKCPTSCEVSGSTVDYDGVVRATPTSELSGFTLTLSGTPGGSAFVCEDYTTILENEVNSLKNDYYTLTANINESYNATYYDLLNKGGSLDEFSIQENNCDSKTRYR